MRTVSVIIPAYDAEAFVGQAIDSALAQELPGGRVEVVVVDDGSTDATARVVEERAARAGGAVRLLRQANAGSVRATNAAMEVASGELIALLDADDAWPAGKLRAQVEALDAAPAAGLVYGDMTVIDADGAVLAGSWLEVIGVADPPRGRCFGRVLASSPATASTLLMRGEVARALTPIPEGIPVPDWWFVLGAARMSELAYVADPRSLYRFHGNNVGLGAEGPALRRSLLRRATLQRWYLRRVVPADAPGLELMAAWHAFEANIRESARLSGSAFGHGIAVLPADRDESARHKADGLADLDAGAPAAAAIAFLRAAACDPWDDGAREAMEKALAGADVDGPVALRLLEAARNAARRPARGGGPGPRALAAR